MASDAFVSKQKLTFKTMDSEPNFLCFFNMISTFQLSQDIDFSKLLNRNLKCKASLYLKNRPFSKLVTYCFQ